MFAKNLDLLMKLTNTSASSLGMACHLDSSHVSRLRNGTRPLPKRPAFLRDMSTYLARHVTADYQKNVMCDKLGLPSWPTNEALAVQAVEQWLTGTQETAPDIAPLLASFSNPLKIPDTAARDASSLPKAKSYYYGVEGKREAVLQFFDMILKEKAPQTLLLFSDEEMGWLYEDAAFSAKWARAFTRVLMAGNRVKIIHSIGRNMNEMLEGVTKWLSIYTTGAVEPYYYPKLRDGIFRRTLFLAPKTAAVISTSVGQSIDNKLNELITDREALEALSLEYMDYFALCKPLMQIITQPDRHKLWQLYDALLREEGDAICMSDAPTLVTMPEWVARAMQERAPESDILGRWRAAADCRDRHAGQYTEFTAFREGWTGEVSLPCADLLGAPGLCYTPEEWQAHLDSAAGAVQSGSAVLKRMAIPPNISLVVKEGVGVIVVKTDAPGVAFTISETNMVNSFWSYLTRLL